MPDESVNPEADDDSVGVSMAEIMERLRSKDWPEPGDSRETRTGNPGYDLEEGAAVVCHRYQRTVDALALACDADLADDHLRDLAAVAGLTHLRAMDEFLWKRRTSNTRDTDVRSVDYLESDIEPIGATNPVILGFGDQIVSHITMTTAVTGSSYWDARGALRLLNSSMATFIRYLEGGPTPQRAEWFRPSHTAMMVHPLQATDHEVVDRVVETFSAGVLLGTYRWREE